MPATEITGSNRVDRNRYWIPAVFLLTLLIPMAATSAAAQQHVFPGERWERIDDPAPVGYDPVKLAAIHDYIDDLNTTGLMVVAHKTAVPPNKSTGWRGFRGIIERLIGARIGGLLN